MTTDDTTLTTNPPDSPWQQLMRRLDTIPAGQLRDLAADVAMEAYLLGIEKEASRHINAGRVVSPTGRPPRADAGASLVSGEYDEAAAHHDAMLREIESLRSQLAEAREQRDHAQRWNDEARRAWAVDSAELAVVRGELAAAREAYQRLAEALGFPGGDLREAIRALRRERDDALQERDRWQQLADERAQNLHATLRRAFAAEDVALALRAERDEARAEIARLERAAHEQGTDLWIAEDRLHWLRAEIDQYATQMERAAAFAAQSGAWSGQIIALYKRHADRLRRMLTATAPETAPESPQTGEQTQVRADTHTGAETGSQGPLDLDAIRAAWLRVCGSCDAGYPTACTCPPGDPRTVIDALAAEIDRLRTEAAVLRARVREWEAVNADLAARCDSGDIPIRLGERYSLAVLREIDRLRTERDRLRRRLGDVLDLEELPEDHTIVAAVRRLRAALGSTPDTGSTT